MKELKATSKPNTKQVKVRYTKCGVTKVKKERKSVNESPIATKCGRHSIVQTDQQKKFTKQEANKSMVVPDV